MKALPFPRDVFSCKSTETVGVRGTSSQIILEKQAGWTFDLLEDQFCPQKGVQRVFGMVIEGGAQLCPAVPLRLVRPSKWNVPYEVFVRIL